MLLDKTKIIMNVVLTLFWVWCTFGFISQEIAPFLLGAKSGFFFIIDVVIFFIGLIVLKDKWDKVYVYSFLILGFFITCVHNGCNSFFYFNGLREFVYLLWIIPILRYIYDSKWGDVFVRKFDTSLFVFLIIQAICVTFQFLKYGANDHGGGSMGNGFSGIVSMLIYLFSFYLMKKRMDPDNILGSLIENKWLVFLLFPTFLNETKISFIFLAFYFMLLFPFNIKSLVKILLMIPVMFVMLILVFNVYMSATQSNHNILNSDFLEAYLYAEEDDEIVEWVSVLQERGEDFVGDGTFDIPRFTKYLMISELNEYYPGHTITGYGIGQFKGGTSIENTKFYKDNEWLLRGSIPYGYHAYIQAGFVAVVFFLLFWVRLQSLKLVNGKFEYEIIVYIIIMTLVVMLYNDFFRYGLLSIPFFYVYSQALRWGQNSEVKTIETK